MPAQAVLFGCLSGLSALRKNLNVALWGLVGFLFGPLGFAASIMTNPDSESKSEISDERIQEIRKQYDIEDLPVHCRYCTQWVTRGDRECKHCGEKFSEVEVEERIQKARVHCGMPRETYLGYPIQKVTPLDPHIDLEYIYDCPVYFTGPVRRILDDYGSTEERRDTILWSLVYMSAMNRSPISESLCTFRCQVEGEWRSYYAERIDDGILISKTLITED